MNEYPYPGMTIFTDMLEMFDGGQNVGGRRSGNFHFDGKAMDYGGSHTTNYIIPLRVCPGSFFCVA
jgi:hypothetical protein